MSFEVSSLDCALLLSFTDAQQTRSSHWSSIRRPFVDGCVVCAYRGLGGYVGHTSMCCVSLGCNSEGAYTYSDVCTPHFDEDLEDNV